MIESVSFVTAANNWRQKLRSSNLSSKTIKTYESILDTKLMPRLSNYSLAEVSSADVQGIVDHYRKAAFGKAYLRMIERVLSLVVNNISPVKITKSPALEISQAKLEAAVNDTEVSALLQVLMRENISMSELLALGIDDVSTDSCEITIRRKMILSQNSFAIKNVRNLKFVMLSKESIDLLATEIRKHSLLSRRPDYNNPDNLIFTDSTGALYDPAYYVNTFKKLSRVLGVTVTPKNLAEFVYSAPAPGELNISDCKEARIVGKGKEYNYIKVAVKAKTGTKVIFAQSIDGLREKYKAAKTPYAFRLTKTDKKFSQLCQVELANMNHLSHDEKIKLSSLFDKHLATFCNNFTVNQVDDDFRVKLMNMLEAQHCKLSTREHITGFLKDVCSTAVKKNFIRYNPFIDVTLKADPVIKYHSLNEKEITKILRLDPIDINNAFLQVKLLTGTRTAEALGLCWNDILPNNKQICIRHQLKANNIVKATKNYKPRKITPPSLAFEILEKVKAKTFHNAHNNLNLIFCNDDGTPLKPDALHERLRSTIGRSNARLHDLRVTAITVLYKTTNDLVLTSKQAGHSDTNVTVKHYVDVVPDLTDAKLSQDKYYEVLKNENQA